MTAHRAYRRRQAGLTLLEVMIVIAILGGGAFLVRGAFRSLTKAELVENATQVVTVLRRAQQMSVENGAMHRVVFDLDKQLFIVEVCQGATAITRNEKLRNDEEETKRAIERGTQKLSELPADALATGNAELAAERAKAVAGHHIADRMCVPAEGFAGDSSGRGLARPLSVSAGVKFKEVWVQHLDDSVTKDQVAVYFFPMGSAEKAVITITDDEATFSVLVHGLTGRIELRDNELRDVDEHMLRDALGKQGAKRETDP